MDTYVDNVTIETPERDETNKNIYFFNLSTLDGEPLVFESGSLYKVNCEQEVQMLTIPSKDDLRTLSTTYNTLKECFLEKHEDWFEQKFTSSDLDDLFKGFLYPNVVDNCIDLKISASLEILNKIKSRLNEDENTCQVIPVFLFDSIILNVDNNKINCKVILHDFQFPTLTAETESEVHTVEEPVVEEPVVEEPVVEEPVVEEPEVEEHSLVESLPEQNELIELDFDTTDLTESEIKVNVEDYLIIYKYILGQIKENKIKEIEEICGKKNIETEILDYEEIFDNSENEYSSDTESENSVS